MGDLLEEESHGFDARTLRVPETANARILGDLFPIQTNHCRTPGCVNFGMPARTKRGKTGPSKDRDLRYAVISTSKGQEPALRCKACNGKGAIRSNAAIAEEVERIADYARPLEHRFACKTEGCANFGLSIDEHRDRYWRRGYYKTPENPLLPVQGLPAAPARLAQGPQDPREEPGALRRRVLSHRQQVPNAPDSGGSRAQQLHQDYYTIVRLHPPPLPGDERRRHAGLPDRRAPPAGERWTSPSTPSRSWSTGRARCSGARSR